MCPAARLAHANRVRRASLCCLLQRSSTPLGGENPYKRRTWSLLLSQSRRGARLPRAIDAIIALGRHLQRRDYHERYVPGNGIDVPDEWEPIPFDEEPAYWDDMPEVEP